MRRMILASALAAVAALLGILVADSERRKAVAAPPVYGVSDAPDDFLLVHEADSVRVLFRDDAGAGSIRFKSLSDASRLEIFHPVVGAEMYSFDRGHGWQTYPHAVAGQFVTVVHGGGRGDGPAGAPTGCSHVVLRIENAAIISPHHMYSGGPGTRCEVCGAALVW